MLSHFNTDPHHLCSPLVLSFPSACFSFAPTLHAFLGSLLLLPYMKTHAGSFGSCRVGSSCLHFPYLASVLLGALTPERIQARIPGGPARSLRWQHPWLCVSPFQVSVPCREGGDGHSCVSFCALLCGWRERPWERAALPATWTWGPSFSDPLTQEKQHAPPPAHLARVTSSPRPLF